MPKKKRTITDNELKGARRTAQEALAAMALSPEEVVESNRGFQKHRIDEYRALARKNRAEFFDVIKELIATIDQFRDSDFGDGVVLRALAADMIERGEPVKPAPLRQYIIDHLRHPVPPTRKASDGRRYMRDLSIVLVIKLLMDSFQLTPTRNPANQNSPSACSIVTEALNSLRINLSEAAVVKIWTGTEAKILRRGWST